VARKPVDEEVEDLEAKVDALAKSLREFESFEEKIDRTIEARVFEIKALAYVILIIVSVLLAFVIGVSAKFFLG
jgi:tetrahydromethanopterin S-methyltransferase subunit B